MNSLSKSKSFRLRTEIIPCISVARVLEGLGLKERDLVITDQRSKAVLPHGALDKCKVLMRDGYGSGLTTDAMLDRMAQDAGAGYERVVGIGGGAVMDCAKILSLETVSPSRDLFLEPDTMRRDRALALVPATPGSGSEVSPYATMCISGSPEQRLLESPALASDEAWLCPDFLSGLPMQHLAAASCESFVHACESYVSPRGTFVSRALCEKAVKAILGIWRDSVRHGLGTVTKYLSELQQAGTLAGIAYALTGAATVHAVAYPLTVRLGVPHGEACYLAFSEVFRRYDQKSHPRALEELKGLLSRILRCREDEAFDAIDRLAGLVVPRRRLRDLGMTEERVIEFTDTVITRCQLLTSNSFVELSPGDIAGIFRALL